MENVYMPVRQEISPIVYMKQTKLFTTSMMLPPNRDENKAEIAMQYIRFYGMNLNKISKHMISSRLEEYEKNHHDTDKDEIAKIMYSVFRHDDSFVKSNGIIIKTHVIYTKYPGQGEHISLPRTRLKDIKYTPWEESDFCDFVTNYEFLFLVFKNDVDDEKTRQNKNTYLSCVIYLKFNEGEIAEAHRVYDLTQQRIWEGVKQWALRNKDGSIRMCPVNKERPVMGNNLPNASESEIFHVRPHADSKVQEELENGDKINGQSFWINREYLRKYIDDNRVHSLFEGEGYAE